MQSSSSDSGSETSESTIVPLHKSNTIIPPPMYNADSATIIPPPEAHYIYYRLYSPDGPVHSKKPVDSQRNPYLGRVDATQIPPPHTTNSLVSIIAEKEGMGFWFNEIGTSVEGRTAELYQTLSSVECFKPFEPLPLVSDLLGSTPHNPVILKWFDFDTSEDL